MSKEELRILKIISSTDGMEVDYIDPILNSLRDKNLVTFSGTRGPGNKWYRVELTNLGEQEINTNV
jgi:DNA-binding PadR family transcriptional regulator